MPETKVCSKCDEEKDIKCFNRDRRSKSGHQSWCKDCAARYREENIDKERARKARYYAENANEIRKRRAQARDPEKERLWKLRAKENNPEDFAEKDRRRGQRYRDKNPNKLRAKHRQYYAANKEKERARRRRYREKNPKKTRESCRRWEEQNPEKVREFFHRRRALKADAPQGDPTSIAIRLTEIYDSPCARCGTTENIHADHIIPLSKGGHHAAYNLQPLCGSCNSKKGTKLPLLLTA